MVLCFCHQVKKITEQHKTVFSAAVVKACDVTSSAIYLHAVEVQSGSKAL